MIEDAALHFVCYYFGLDFDKWFRVEYFCVEMYVIFCFNIERSAHLEFIRFIREVQILYSRMRKIR